MNRVILGGVLLLAVAIVGATWYGTRQNKLEANSSAASGLVGGEGGPITNNLLVTYPQEGGTINLGFVYIDAKATNLEYFEKMEFYLDGALVGTGCRIGSQTPPPPVRQCSLRVTAPTTVGTHTTQVKAQTKSGTLSSSPVSFEFRPAYIQFNPIAISATDSFSTPYAQTINVRSGSQVFMAWTTNSARSCTVSADDGNIKLEQYGDQGYFGRAKTSLDTPIRRNTVFTVTCYNASYPRGITGTVTANVLR